eukprot:gnl/Dysnectes_brevis/4426_a5945_839.p1 GENE.gnl/Dysnectes_brevis/4426_a5945_839~~gnl/Dysnectes_brevis/4426_a5945_839.p1  ORF type:complete len:275 (+),score=40.68 gnl/Dysnectes_brevis/4426_a5945_839:42-827(+)
MNNITTAFIVEGRQHTSESSAPLSPSYTPQITDFITHLSQLTEEYKQIALLLDRIEVLGTTALFSDPEHDAFDAIATKAGDLLASSHSLISNAPTRALKRDHSLFARAALARMGELLEEARERLTTQLQRRATRSSLATSDLRLGEPSEETFLDLDHSESAELAVGLRGLTVLDGRQSGTSEVVSSIRDLGRIYRKAAAMVQRDGEGLLRLDRNLTKADEHVETANSLLGSAYQRLKKHQKNVIMFFVALLIVAALMAVVK